MSTNKIRIHLLVLRMLHWTIHHHHLALPDHRTRVVVQQHQETSDFPDNLINSVPQTLSQITLLIRPQDQALLWPVRKGKFEPYDNNGIMLQVRRKVYEGSKHRAISTARAAPAALLLLLVDGRVLLRTSSHRRLQG